MNIQNITHNTSTTYTIQYGDSWLNDYLVYTEYVDDRGKVIDYTLVDQDGKNITDSVIKRTIDNTGVNKSPALNTKK